ncbi:MAG TPA: hypothetical protein VLB73_00130 [Patescibacteria group bacterium]|nr:hypothetical protein [Patescibacteria group bacterium]
MSERKTSRAKTIARERFNVGLQQEIGRAEQQRYYEQLVESKTFLENRLQEKIGRKTLDGWIVCGSGLAGLADSPDITIHDKIPMEQIPHWFVPTAPGHGKELVIADIGGQEVGIMTGRAHMYDTDYSPQQLKMITAPLRVAKGLGINWLVTTNAAGALDNGNVHVGDVVVDVDYVNQNGVNPLIGPNDDRLGQRFPGKADTADPHLFALLEDTIPANNLHLGIYTMAINAPLYEGRGDIANGMYPALSQQNPDMVQLFGMSFATEAMVMQHYNDPSTDSNGFDRKIPWIGLTAATNIISRPEFPTKESLRRNNVASPNPTNAEEVLSGGKIAERYLIPAVIKLATSLSQQSK